MGRRVMIAFMLGMFFSLFNSTMEFEISRAEASGGGQGSIVGQWRWFNGATVTFRPDGSCDATNGFYGAWKNLYSGEFEIQWKRPGQGTLYIDTMQLSVDGKRLSGKNQHGSGVSATRLMN